MCQYLFTAIGFCCWLLGHILGPRDFFGHHSLEHNCRDKLKAVMMRRELTGLDNIVMFQPFFYSCFANVIIRIAVNKKDVIVRKEALHYTGLGFFDTSDVLKQCLEAKSFLCVQTDAQFLVFLKVSEPLKQISCQFNKFWEYKTVFGFCRCKLVKTSIASPFETVHFMYHWSCNRSSHTNCVCSWNVWDSYIHYFVYLLPPTLDAMPTCFSIAIILLVSYTYIKFKLVKVKI